MKKRASFLIAFLLALIFYPARFASGATANIDLPDEDRKPKILPRYLQDEEKKSVEAELQKFDYFQFAQYQRLKRLPPNTSEIPVEKYALAKERIRRMKSMSNTQNRYSSAFGEALEPWVSLGPDNFGGRTRSLIIHPTNPQIMYAGSVAGGVWRTTNGGVNWEPLTDLLANLSIACLAFDSKNPRIIYAGTGEGYFNFHAIRGSGIFKSMDGGNTWQFLTNTHNQDFYFVNDIVVSPNDSQRIYAATNTGIWFSADAGITWSLSYSAKDVIGGCLDLAIRTDQITDYIFASCGTFEPARIVRNTDCTGAGKWDIVLSEPAMGRTSLAIAPSNQNVVYACASSMAKNDFQYGLQAVFRSNNSGESGTWNPQVRNTDANRLNTLLLSNPIAATVRNCNFIGSNEIVSQGWYDNVITVDPIDENCVWVGGFDLFRSDDGGRNWGLASYWWAGKNSSQYVHSAHHVIAFPPDYNGTTNKIMFVGNDGGLFRTDDSHAEVAFNANATCNPENSKIDWKPMNTGYAATQFYHGAVYPDGLAYLGGAQGAGTIRGSAINGPSAWEVLLSGEGGYVAIDPINPKIIFASNPGGQFRKSTDNGATFSRSIFGLKDNQRLFLTPLVMDPSDSQHLWTGGGFLWRTDKGAANWKRVSNQKDLLITAIAVAPSDSNAVLAASWDLGILRTDNALLADSETKWRAALPRVGFISGLAFDPKNSKIAYATYSTFGDAHVWKSIDGGISWAGIDGVGSDALPDVPVNCVIVDPTNSARIFVGTDLGLFVSTTGGNSWSPENTGFANVSVESLAVDTVNGTASLFAFTNGRGAWQTRLGKNCRTTLSKTSENFTQVGGTGAVAVSSDCNWVVELNSSAAGWITINSTENNIVNYTVAPNLHNGPRTGTLNIGGRSYAVTQPSVKGSFSNADLTLPEIKITAPDPNQIHKVTDKFINLRGTATDDRGIEEIYYVNDRDGKKNSIEFSAASSDWEVAAEINGGINPLTVFARDAAGNLSQAKITIVYEVPRTIITLAGIGVGINSGGYSGDDGVAASAQLKSPRGIVVDASGNVIFVDGENHRVRKISSDGIITTIAGDGTPGFGGDGGVANRAKLDSPFGLAIDRLGNLYVADTGNHRVRKIDLHGIITTVAGNGNFSPVVTGDGSPAKEAELNEPRAIAIDGDGNLYIGDASLERIRKVEARTGIISTIAGAGADGVLDDGVAALTAKIGAVTDLAIDKAGNIYFSQGSTTESRIKKISVDGKISTFGNVIAATGLSIDAEGNLLATSSIGGQVYKLTADGQREVIAGSGRAITNDRLNIGDGGLPTDAILYRPMDVATDGSGNIFISDSEHRIRKILDTPVGDHLSPTIAITSPTDGLTFTTLTPTLRLSGTSADNVLVTHVTWSNNRGGNGICIGTVAWTTSQPDLSGPSTSDVQLQPGLNVITVTAWDLGGNSTNATITINYNPYRIIDTVAGNLSNGYSGENVAATVAQLWSPENIVIDKSGNIFIADRGNHVIRKVTRDGIISTFAGTGQLGSSGDGGPAIDASFNEPTGVALDEQGDLFVADSQNNRIRKISPNGIITTFAGTGIQDFSGDEGPAQNASLNLPTGIAIDLAGNLFFADRGNNRIRKITKDGTIFSVAGINVDGFTGDGGPARQAQLSSPTHLVTDRSGNVFFSDTGNSRVREITADGVIKTIAGGDEAGFSGDGGPGIDAKLNSPAGLALDAAGNLYIADQSNHRIRRLSPEGKINTIAGTGIAGAKNKNGDALNTELSFPAGVTVDLLGNLYISDTENHRLLKVRNFNSVTSVSAASYWPNHPVAPESIVSAFGPNLAATVVVNDRLPLPTELAGVKVKVSDSNGVERLAPLYFISPYQVNYQIPKDTSLGLASISVINNDVVMASEILQVVNTQPGFFSANSDGQGAPAASLLFVAGSNRWNDVTYNCMPGQPCSPKPIDLNSADEIYLEMFGTGIRYRSDLSNVRATIDGIEVPVLYAGPHCCFVGVDQINLPIPKNLKGRGEVEVRLMVDGYASNSVRVNLK